MTTYTKLKSGDWGLKISDTSVKSGDQVTVRKRSGETKTETVGNIIWKNDEQMITSIKRAQRKRSGCGCDEEGCCRPRCQCDPTCNCRGGNIYNC